jgi:dTMP kinase
MSNGICIAFEGIDGSGKSTQIQLLANKLAQMGKQVHVTAEPTTGPIGKMLRQIFSGALPANQHTIAALFAADRLEHITNTTDGMLQQLQQGHIVILDRYYLSSYAYHSVHVPMPWVINCNTVAVSLLPATVHIYIDMPPAAAMERITANRTNIEMYETLENLTAVYNNYATAINLIKDKEKVVVVNGNQALEQVAADIWEEVKGIW